MPRLVPDTRSIFIAALLIFGVSCAKVLADSELALDTPLDLVGEHVIVDAVSGDVLARARVEVSARGLRSSNVLDGRQAIMNFTLGQYWLIDRARRLVHRVPVSAKIDPDAPVHSEPDPAIAVGVFSPIPCTPWSIGTATQTHWRGQKVRLVDCVDNAGALRSVQYYNPDLGIVVRSVSGRGIAEEFRHVQRSPIDDARFLPPLHFESVELDVLYRTGLPLSGYVGAAPVQPGSDR